MKIVAFLLFILLNLYSNPLKTADKCNVSYSIMQLYGIAEHSPKRPIGYPFLISFNNFKIPSLLKNTHNYIKLDTRTIDCMNVENCVRILDKLVANNINNIDIGAFQANYIHFKYPHEEYFILDASYYNACTRVRQLIDRYGLSWKTLARYHSSTPKFNKKYRKKLMELNEQRGGSSEDI